MKVNTVMPYLFNGTYVDYTETYNTDLQRTIRTYFEAGDFKMRFIVNGQLRRPVIYTKKRLQLLSRIKNITDLGGRAITDGVVYEVKQELPVTNAFGFSDGYSYLLGIANED